MLSKFFDTFCFSKNFWSSILFEILSEKALWDTFFSESRISDISSTK